MVLSPQTQADLIFDAQPDPFILAAEQLGYDPKNCLVVEDSPSGIKAGVASGAKTIAVCTSHPHEKSEYCNANVSQRSRS